jgi:5-methylcytosine-specific restriction endonuclease McrA
VASRFRSYFQVAGVVSEQQAERMKHIELASELIYSAYSCDVAGKKKVLDEIMDRDTLKGQTLQKAVIKSASALSRLRRMFPSLNRSVRFHKISDFYTLAVLIQKIEAEGLVLTDRRRNKLAWEILVAFGTGVDQIAEALRTFEIKKLEPGQDLCRDYLQTVKEGVDSLLNRRKREQILRGLIGSLFEIKAANRLFTPEQRRIIWNTTDVRACADCREVKELTWDDFQLDHVRPHSKGGQTELANAALRCALHNRKKGAKY